MTSNRTAALMRLQHPCLNILQRYKSRNNKKISQQWTSCCVIVHLYMSRHLISDAGVGCYIALACR